jgi:hypothetical protein
MIDMQHPAGMAPRELLAQPVETLLSCHDVTEPSGLRVLA